MVVKMSLRSSLLETCIQGEGLREAWGCDRMLVKAYRGIGMRTPRRVRDGRSLRGRRIAWLRMVSSVALALLVLLPAACGSSKPSASATPTPHSPHAALGYWRPTGAVQYPQLVCIRLIQGQYFLWAPPIVRVPLTVEGNRLIHHIYENGKETGYSALWVRPDGRLAWASYVSAGSGSSAHFRMLPAVGNFTRATGSDAQLAAELRGRSTQSTIEKQVHVLVDALGKWAGQHGGYPPRAALLPGGVFWKWPGAPHLTNAVTGGPMVLGSGAGNFDYTRTGRWSYSVSGHTYGGGETIESGGAP
jgi:hypothetical protein